jgi:hypothetical protein
MGWHQADAAEQAGLWKKLIEERHLRVVAEEPATATWSGDVAIVAAELLAAWSSIAFQSQVRFFSRPVPRSSPTVTHVFLLISLQNPQTGLP